VADDPHWRENDSRAFIELGDQFVPYRSTQHRVLTDLIPGTTTAFQVLELGCGAGLLADAILRVWPTACVTGLDASAAMRKMAREHNAAHGDRFETMSGDIGDVADLWDRAAPHAIVSSLALHHLTDEDKRRLFLWAADELAPGGALLIADVIRPAGPAGQNLAAAMWDESVQRATRAAGGREALEIFRRDAWNMYALSEPDPEDRPAMLCDQLQWLIGAGFEEVDVFWMFAGHAIYGGFVAAERGR
jgi:tRNA (cmo5U34)-methyltransferase